MYNSYEFDEQTQWVKRDCTCDTCEKKIEELTERCMKAEGEIVSVDDFNKTIIDYVRKNSRNSILAKAKDEHKSKDSYNTGNRTGTISFRNN